MTPLIDLSFGQYSPVLASHNIGSRLFANSRRLDSEVYSGGLVVELGLHQGCVRAPLQLNIFFAACRRASHGDVGLGHALR